MLANIISVETRVKNTVLGSEIECEFHWKVQENISTWSASMTAYTSDYLELCQTWRILIIKHSGKSHFPNESETFEVIVLTSVGRTWITFQLTHIVFMFLRTITRATIYFSYCSLHINKTNPRCLLHLKLQYSNYMPALFSLPLLSSEAVVYLNWNNLDRNLRNLNVYLIVLS